MGKPTGFKEVSRETPKRRPVSLRLADWSEIYLEFPEDKLRKQGARCMDCGVPFCNHGCPLGNQIPDWNDLIYRGKWRDALDSLHKTNNFPEWTGRVCPAPCEEACVLTVNDKPVTIKLIEQSIIERGFAEGWVTPQPPATRTGKKVAVIGSGPAGLAAAAQLNKAGHLVTVLERDNRPGGLLIYGIPDFKMDKSTVDRRVTLLEAEGITFRCGVEVGRHVSTDELRREFDAIVVCIGATQARDVKVPGRELAGIHLAMNYLPQQTQLNLGDEIFEQQKIDARDQDVVIIGGGDTAADCLGTSLRQGCRSVVQFDINPMPPKDHNPRTPWPSWQMVLRSSAAHEEASETAGRDIRDWSILTQAFLGDASGRVRALRAVRIESHKDEQGNRHVREIPGSEFEIPATLVLIAIGFSGPETQGPIQQLGLKLTPRGSIDVDENYQTNVPGVFAAGDARRGQSLVVWAISEGRQAARACDQFLMGHSDLPKLHLM
jgi:glutamate synthase (NADPH/NADH) small chain